MLKKIIWANFQRIIDFLPKKLSISSQKYGFGIRDPGSGKNLFLIPDPGVKKDPRSRIRIRNIGMNITGLPVPWLFFPLHLRGFARFKVLNLGCASFTSKYFSLRTKMTETFLILEAQKCKYFFRFFSLPIFCFKTPVSLFSTKYEVFCFLFSRFVSKQIITKFFAFHFLFSLLSEKSNVFLSLFLHVLVSFASVSQRISMFHLDANLAKKSLPFRFVCFEAKMNGAP